MIIEIHFSNAQNNGLTGIEIPPAYANNSNYVNCVLVDKQDNVWLAFNNNGIAKYSPATSQWNFYNDTNSAFPATRVYSLTQDATGNIWAGTFQGLVKFDGSNFTLYNKTNSPIPDNSIPFVRAYNNDIWMSSGNSAMLFANNNWQIYNDTNSGLTGIVYCIAVDSSGAVWFASNTGLTEWKNNVWQTFTFSTSNNYVYWVEAGQNKIWVATYEGFYYNNPNNTFTKYDFDFDSPLFSKPNNHFLKIKNNVPYFKGRDLLELNDSLSYYFLSSSVSIKFDIDSKGREWFANYDSIFVFDKMNYSEPVFTPCAGNCITYNNAQYLDINQTKALITDNGNLHYSLDNYEKQYLVPKGIDKSTVYATGLILGGLDDGGNLHLAGQTYRQGGSDFWPGPLDTISANTDSATANYYDKVWKINRYDVEEFKYMFENGQVQNGNYKIPKVILDWPANGINNQSKNLAPFFDINHDGNYNPYDGDYPEMKGDQMIWFILNDNLAAHTETGGLPIGIEIHGAAYSYFCDSLPDSLKVMNNTTLYHLEYINRSANNYHEMYAGIFSDFDIGNYVDDLGGCDTANNIGFGYNGDNNDDGPSGYGLNPPMMNVQFLKGPEPPLNDGLDNNHDGQIDEQGERCMMDHFVLYDNFNGVSGNPNGAPHYYNYLKSLWGDSTHITYGQFGNNPLNPPTNFMYSGPFDSTGWTQYGGGPPNDLRFISSSGPFSLASHQTQTLDFAYVFTRDSTAPNGLTTSVARNISDVKKIKHWFDTDSFPSCIKFEFLPIPPSVVIDSSILIYPNPAVYNFTLNVSDDYLNNSEIKIYDALGQLVLKMKLQSKTISVEKLFRKGIYYVVLDKNGELRKGKFVKW